MKIKKIRSYFPDKREISRVFSLVVFIIYTWSIFRMIYQLPSWLLAHNLKEIGIYSTYIFSSALIESVLVFSFIFLIGAVLPKKVYWEKFLINGSLTTLVIAAWGILLQSQKPNLLDYKISMLLIILVLFLSSLVFLNFLGKNQLVREKNVLKLVSDFAERTIIFSWIYLPIGFISLLYVIYRIV